jgi:hypothetical protein
MGRAVDLDNEPSIEAREVGDEIVQHDLASKAEP